MAKSMRSKVKRSFRSKKREDGIYAATEAARLARLNAKLTSVTARDKEGDVALPDAEGEGAEEIPEEEGAAQTEQQADSMDLDASTEKSQRISTHGPRNSRNEEWRASKGLVPKPKHTGVNRQGGIAGRRKAGRSKRRR